ncbi:hypothetical protein BV25DRAFT_1724766 [Artomyces pyxidatus]|uniref:Uncharacterized protein n=1 Tax=Artomyces pyxidatus TaxID=48021 RepID=A0ACB8SIP2_9AGAM|nr:hypothetical protein BV25DRAFT_1724766 [Artomyces pyxidatus]
MPAARSSTVQSRATHPYMSQSPAPSPASASVEPPENNEVIVISSDDEDTPPVVAVRRRTVSRKGKARRVPSFEIIEIPDNTQAPVGAHLSEDPRDLKDEVRRLRDDARKWQIERARLLDDNARYIVEVDRLRTEAMQKGQSIPLSSVEDIVCCEICTLKMWSPYMCVALLTLNTRAIHCMPSLPDCGHIFCYSCILDWFSTIHAKHLQTYPHYNANIVGIPRPSYSCPSCRVEARVRPVECFAVKSMVRLVGDVVGEHSPQKQAPRRGQPEAVWDGFFGRR